MTQINRLDFGIVEDKKSPRRARTPGGWPTRLERADVSKNICIVDDCQRERYGHGYCALHWNRWRKHGDPHIVLPSCRKARPTAERLWARIDRTVPGCWPYPGYQSRSGHCQIWNGAGMDPVHRVAWVDTFGPIPIGLAVCHHCDNPPCCRPDHLFLGTIADNNRDRDRKGRHKPLLGEANGLAKLTEADVRAIRASYIPRINSTYSLAKQYGVHQSLIWSVIHRKVWTHVV